MEYLNSVLLIPHCEYRVDEEVESRTSTQYPVMSGSTNGISSVKGGVQVMEGADEHGSGVIPSEPTTDNAPVYTTLLKHGLKFPSRGPQAIYNEGPCFD